MSVKNYAEPERGNRRQYSMVQALLMLDNKTIDTHSRYVTLFSTATVVT